MLSAPGACASTASDLRKDRRDSVPLENIAADLQPDDEDAADDGGHDLGRQPGAPGTDQLKSLTVMATASAVVTSETATSTP